MKGKTSIVKSQTEAPVTLKLEDAVKKAVQDVDNPPSGVQDGDGHAVDVTGAVDNTDPSVHG